MTNLVNISRDSMWITDIENTTAIAWSTDLAAAVNSDGVVYEKVASVKSNGTSVVSTAQQSVGLFMRPPTEDYVPYRVKVYAPSSALTYLNIAYAPSTITGSDDILEHSNFIQFDTQFDEIVMLPPHDTAHAYYNRPISFSISTFTSGINNISISVQNLGLAPPKFAMGVS